MAENEKINGDKSTKKTPLISAIKRLHIDYSEIVKKPLPSIYVAPNPTNYLECNKDSVYSGGIYYGKLIFPKDYPFKPPGIIMITPSGRFKVNQKLCLSVSDFHPEEWSPTWTAGTFLLGLYSFMLEETPTYGSINSSFEERKKLASQSIAFNLKISELCKAFPEIAQEMADALTIRETEEQRKKAEKQLEVASTSSNKDK